MERTTSTSANFADCGYDYDNDPNYMSHLSHFEKDEGFSSLLFVRELAESVYLLYLSRPKRAFFKRLKQVWNICYDKPLYHYKPSRRRRVLGNVELSDCHSVLCNFEVTYYVKLAKKRNTFIPSSRAEMEQIFSKQCYYSSHDRASVTFARTPTISPYRHTVMTQTHPRDYLALQEKPVNLVSRIVRRELGERFSPYGTLLDMDSYKACKGISYESHRDVGAFTVHRALRDLRRIVKVTERCTSVVSYGEGVFERCVSCSAVIYITTYPFRETEIKRVCDRCNDNSCNDNK